MTAPVPDGMETTAEERANLRKHGECAPLTAFYGSTMVKIDGADVWFPPTSWEARA
jgi:hypothetical protein